MAWLGAVQAQEYGPAKWGLALRSSPGTRDSDVERAVNRAVPKAHRWFNRAKSQDLVATTLMHVRSGVCVLNVDWDPGMDIYMVHPANPESAYRTRTTTGR